MLVKKHYYFNWSPQRSVHVHLLCCCENEYGWLDNRLNKCLCVVRLKMFVLIDWLFKQLYSKQSTLSLLLRINYLLICCAPNEIYHKKFIRRNIYLLIEALDRNSMLHLYYLDVWLSRGHSVSVCFFSVFVISIFTCLMFFFHWWAVYVQNIYYYDTEKVELKWMKKESWGIKTSL